MGTLLALYWSLLSVYTNSVINAYFLPLRGVLGAGEGGRSWPSMSCGINAFPTPLSFPFELSGSGESDMLLVVYPFLKPKWRLTILHVDVDASLCQSLRKVGRS